MILACDFDGVIHNPITHDPIPGALDHLRWLHTRDHTILIHTANRPSFVETWLADHAVRHHGIHPKPRADVYLDDRAMRFTDWETAWEMLK